MAHKMRRILLSPHCRQAKRAILRRLLIPYKDLIHSNKETFHCAGAMLEWLMIGRRTLIFLSWCRRANQAVLADSPF